MKKLSPQIFLLAAALVVAGACLVPDVNLDGKACSTNDPCADTYQCIQGHCLLPGDLIDGGGIDAGTPAVDAGIPTSVATLVGVNAFTIGGVYNDSTLAGATRGSDVSIYIGEHIIFCDNESTTPGWLMEIDATANTVASFGTGSYPVTNSLDAGVVVEVHLSNPNLEVSFDSTSPTPTNQIHGSLTFTDIQPDYIVGTMAFTVGMADGGTTPLTGTFTANDSSCQ